MSITILDYITSLNVFKLLIDRIDGTHKSKITGIKLFYHPQLFKDGDKFNFMLKT